MPESAFVNAGVAICRGGGDTLLHDTPNGARGVVNEPRWCLGRIIHYPLSIIHDASGGLVVLQVGSLAERSGIVRFH